MIGSVTLTAQECVELKKHAVNGLSARAEIAKLREQLTAAERTASIWQQRYETLHDKYIELKKKAQPYLDALEAAGEKVRAFISYILAWARDSRNTHIDHERSRKEDAIDR